MFGLFLSFLLLKGINVPKETRKSLVNSILLFIAFNLFYGFANKGIDNAAHVGGLLSGFLIGLIYFPSYKKTELSKYFSASISVLILAFIFVLPHIVEDRIGEFQDVLKKVSVNEEKALWMYREDISNSPDKVQYYYDRLRNEGIDLWQENIAMLDNLQDLPSNLQERVISLIEYCELRSKSCETMQMLLRSNKSSDQDSLKQINMKIERILGELNK